MTFDLRAALPELMPRAVAWAERQSALILSNGVTLGSRGIEIAREAGVAYASAVRVLIVPEISGPDDSVLSEANKQVQLVGPHLAGLTFAHGIFIRSDHQGSAKTLAHELRHVHQYERLGSIAGFLAEYLPQIVEYGYDDAPLEVEAKEEAERLFPSG